MPETIPMPPPRNGERGPTMATIEEIERILRKADGPISLNEVKRRMRAKSVPHTTVRLAINHLIRYGLVIEGSKGVMWARGQSRAKGSDPESTQTLTCHVEFVDPVQKACL